MAGFRDQAREQQVRPGIHPQAVEMMLPNPRGVKPQAVRQDRLLTDLQDEVTRGPGIVRIVIITQRKIAKIHDLFLSESLRCIEE
jgi:hypothetical protein